MANGNELSLDFQFLSNFGSNDPGELRPSARRSAIVSTLGEQRSPDLVGENSISRVSEPTVSSVPSTVEGEKVKNLKAARAGLAAVNFITDISNANSAYQNTVGTANMNIMMSKANELDAYSRGRQAAMDEKTKASLAVDEVQQSLAAQGVDINAPGAQNISQGYEAMGAYNAMKQELNMYREAFKYQMEQVQLEYAIDVAAANRNMAVVNSFLNNSANAAFAFAGV